MSDDHVYVKFFYFKLGIEPFFRNLFQELKTMLDAANAKYVTLLNPLK